MKEEWIHLRELNSISRTVSGGCSDIKRAVIKSIGDVTWLKMRNISEDDRAIIFWISIICTYVPVPMCLSPASIIISTRTHKTWCTECPTLTKSYSVSTTGIELAALSQKGEELWKDEEESTEKAKGHLLNWERPLADVMSIYHADIVVILCDWIIVRLALASWPLE